MQFLLCLVRVYRVTIILLYYLARVAIVTSISFFLGLILFLSRLYYNYVVWIIRRCTLLHKQITRRTQP